jgi:transcriptional regulator GlxA family with amidase domain
VLAFPDAQALDVTGPWEVFAMANRVGDPRAPRYALSLVAPAPGPIATSGGLSLVPHRRLLEGTTRTVADVAEACGFGRVETMHRAFRRVLRVAPGQYRHHFRAAPRGGAMAF